jgi:dipeptidyl aminopeptidase/acylaminoacyl peptidase
MEKRKKALKPYGKPGIILVFIIALFCLAAALPAQEKNMPPAEWKVEDVINQEAAGSFEISPDGNWAVWVKTTVHKEKDGRVRHLYLTSLGEKIETLQLTRGEDNEFSPKWSPSGNLIGFLSSRKGKDDKEETSGAQLWLMDRRGGEPWQVTQLSQGVMGYEWIDDNNFLFLAREDRTLRELEQKEKKDTTTIAEDQEHMPPIRLFLFAIKEKKATRLTQNTDQIATFRLSHDKKWVLTANNQSVRFGVDKKVKPKFFLVNLADKSSTELFTDRYFKPQMMAWAADDKGFYFSILRTSDYENEGPGADFLYYFDLESRKYEEVPLDWDWGLFYFGFMARQDGFVASLANGSRPKWRRYAKSGNSYSYQELEGKHSPNIYSLVLQEKGNKVIYGYSTASLPVQWHIAELAGNEVQAERPLVELNAHLKDKTKAKTELVKWIGALDEEVEGILYYPHDYREGKRYPLVLSIHGGPTGVDMDVFDESWGSYPNLLAQRGAFVFQPNYHGSGGYGQKFAESIKGHYYDYEIPDMLKGIDELVKKGMVDPERLATMGWSNGGILSIALTTWTDRFKCAGIGAADVNWISDYGNCAFGVSFDNYYFTGAPWDQIEHYIKKSPLFHLKNMSVPTIIFHGTEDTNVPYGQGWEYYRALQQIGKAPVRFVIFPGEPHGLGKLTHQQKKMEEELAWFDKYFFKTDEAKNEALKKGSPLDSALKMQAMARAGNLYGERYKGVLIPELVKTKELAVGRYEVTRAQWAAFDKSYSYEKGTENYPVSGIAFDQAQKYVKWLSTLTGKSYRLPKASEAEKLASQAGKVENTLDYWAGYALNPDDAALILQKVKELKGKAPLLLPVDRFLPGGDDLIFGLGGNAAEWAVDDAGKGKIMGRSAIAPVDARGQAAAPPLEYVSLRVVLSIQEK